jgi:hypothetical protein
LTLPLRSTLAVLLAALAFACAGLGERGNGRQSLDGPPASALHAAREAAADRVEAVRPRTPARRGVPGMERSELRPDSVPWIVPGAESTHPPLLPAPGAARRPSAAIPSRALRPEFARHLAAARDGTLSSRATGLPPPVPA